MITSAGYTPAFPAVFGTSASASSLLTEAMDTARGGKFTSVPASYPAAAWYTYTDTTCTYTCMAVEYIYWAIRSQHTCRCKMQTKRCTNIKVLKSLIWSHKCSLWMSDKSHTMNELS